MGQKYIQKIFNANLQWFDERSVGEIIERATAYQSTVEN